MRTTESGRAAVASWEFSLTATAAWPGVFSRECAQPTPVLSIVCVIFWVGEIAGFSHPDSFAHSTRQQTAHKFRDFANRLPPILFLRSSGTLARLEGVVAVFEPV